jgi:hypothetical protein
MIGPTSPRPELDSRLVHEFWRMQLLDELHRKLEALEWEAALDPHGIRRAGLLELIDHFEAVEAGELAEREREEASEHATLQAAPARNAQGRLGVARAPAPKSSGGERAPRLRDVAMRLMQVFRRRPTRS